MAISLLERSTLRDDVRQTLRSGLADEPVPARQAGRVERWATFVLPLTGYLVLGFLFTLRWHVYFGDAVSREANGFYVLFSNNPHLAAIGFVWNPLTSIVEMPLILLHGIFPALTREALAASIMSAVFMAGTCYQVFRFFEDLSLSRAAKWAFLLCFALNPMIIVYGASGMSEALFNFTLVVTARYLARWLRYGNTRSLVTSAIWLGIAYAARNEVVAGAAAGTLLVAGATFLRTDGRMRQRRFAGLSDALIFSLPFAASFLLWAGVSWVIVGHPFEQLSSAYGTASQIKVQGYNTTQAGIYGATGLGHLRYTAIAMWTLAPLSPLILAVALYRGWKYRNPAILAVISIVGGVCVFELAAFTLGQITWGYRYDIYVVLLSVMAAGCATSPIGVDPSTKSAAIVLSAGRRARSLRGVSGGLMLLLLLPGFVTTEHTEFYSSINTADQKNYEWVLWPHSRRTAADPYRLQWSTIRAFDEHLTRLHLPNGSLMVDNFVACIPPLIMMSPNPRQFAIPNDQNFKGRLGTPYQEGVRYMLVSDPLGTWGRLDSLNVAFPSLYNDGADLGTMVEQVTLPVCGNFRLYRLFATHA